MSEILEMDNTIQVNSFQKEKEEDSTLHYEPFEEVLRNVPYNTVVEMAEAYYKLTVFVQGGVIDE